MSKHVGEMCGKQYCISSSLYSQFRKGSHNKGHGIRRAPYMNQVCLSVRQHFGSDTIT